MKVTILTVRQPWAWLIVAGHKPIENRDWSTNYRGRLYIHAAQVVDDAAFAWVAERFPELSLPFSMPTGAVIGHVQLKDCVRKSSSPWFRGKFGFTLAQPHELPTPVSMRGMPGLFSGEVP
jgi:hypothetical protein